MKMVYNGTRDMLSSVMQLIRLSHMKCWTTQQMFTFLQCAPPQWGCYRSYRLHILLAYKLFSTN